MEESKKIFALKDLVEEIYGSSRDSESFASNYKDLQRIDKAFRGISDYDKSTGILEEHKDTYIKVIKEMISDANLKGIVSKIGREKELTAEENDKYIKFMLESLAEESLKAKVYEMKDIGEHICRIEDKVKRILSVIPNYFDVSSTDLMKIVLDKYEDGIDKLHNEIQNKCKELDGIYDERYERSLLEKVNGYGEKLLNRRVYK